jgi:hypothetical protein
VIGPKEGRPTASEERRAYGIATERDDLTCQMCLRWCGAPQMDHRQNRQSGNTVASNLQTLGVACHLEKTEHPAWAVAEGWAVPRYADPREWPARRYFRTPLNTVRKGWALLDDVGGVHEISEDEARKRMEGVLP